MIHFNRVFHYKPSILGYPYFWKHPNSNQKNDPWIFKEKKTGANYTEVFPIDSKVSFFGGFTASTIVATWQAPMLTRHQPVRIVPMGRSYEKTLGSWHQVTLRILQYCFTVLLVITDTYIVKVSVCSTVMKVSGAFVEWLFAFFQ